MIFIYLGLFFLIFFIVFFILALKTDYENLFGILCCVTLVLSLVGFIIGSDQYPIKYQVYKIEVLYNETEDNEIQRIWLEKNGSYFWIEVPSDMQQNFEQGATVKISDQQLRRCISSKTI